MPADRIEISLAYLFGFFLLMSGTFIRMSCYNTLGRLFTFELSIRKDHKLITTGPYSIVRHPSYAGLIFNLVGIAVCYTGKGSWLKECTLNGQLFQALAWIWMFYGILCIFLRMRNEDDMLKKEFGKDWKAWRKAVPCKIFPGVY
jgi:protein-S-isoprenylcysteine O-methyltransferase Ste14